MQGRTSSTGGQAKEQVPPVNSKPYRARGIGEVGHVGIFDLIQFARPQVQFDFVFEAGKEIDTLVDFPRGQSSSSHLFRAQEFSERGGTSPRLPYPTRS